ncbi:hypothetical protein Ade02nite_37840 [Paractinoplanes deccanensis]|uniref:NUDIX hydrolase n=1 Tax=Paractinoplanes deccanensis TaxID=113561 RepID=A0ABQ3Y578_9ACTN|nr:hypothetical protein [Actinoplanes deccanensis]GID75143.1 hypothetical protein Ade02nite_37840 [Actinoplanes deccanensis]
MIDSPALAHSVPGAPWLPTGSRAEVWAGHDLDVPEPTVIVRLALFRDGKLFCVRTPKGFDIPTQFLDGRTPSEGVSHLTARYLHAPTTRAAPTPDREAGAYSGDLDVAGERARRPFPPAGGVATRCIGFVRNIVPVPDASYRLPVPLAHVPVFTPRDPQLRPADSAGTWIGLADGADLLGERHWWPIARWHADRLG